MSQKKLDHVIPKIAKRKKRRSEVELLIADSSLQVTPVKESISKTLQEDLSEKKNDEFSASIGTDCLFGDTGRDPVTNSVIILKNSNDNMSEKKLNHVIPKIAERKKRRSEVELLIADSSLQVTPVKESISKTSQEDLSEKKNDEFSASIRTDCLFGDTGRDPVTNSDIILKNSNDNMSEKKLNHVIPKIAKRKKRRTGVELLIADSSLQVTPVKESISKNLQDDLSEKKNDEFSASIGTDSSSDDDTGRDPVLKSVKRRKKTNYKSSASVDTNRLLSDVTFSDVKRGPVFKALKRKRKKLFKKSKHILRDVGEELVLKHLNDSVSEKEISNSNEKSSTHKNKMSEIEHLVIDLNGDKALQLTPLRKINSETADKITVMTSVGTNCGSESDPTIKNCDSSSFQRNINHMIPEINKWSVPDVTECLTENPVLKTFKNKKSESITRIMTETQTKLGDSVLTKQLVSDTESEPVLTNLTNNISKREINDMAPKKIKRKRKTDMERLLDDLRDDFHKL